MKKKRKNDLNFKTYLAPKRPAPVKALRFDAIVSRSDWVAFLLVLQSSFDIHCIATKSSNLSVMFDNFKSMKSSRFKYYTGKGI